METTPFDLTPEQKDLLESLAQETGKSISTLLAEALEGLQEHVRGSHVHEDGHSHGDKISAVPSPCLETKHIWEVAEELFGAIPDEELARLPTDGAAQHDHYIYGTPKRPT
jgi:hypothetical protein